MLKNSHKILFSGKTPTRGHSRSYGMPIGTGIAPSMKAKSLPRPCRGEIRIAGNFLYDTLLFQQFLSKCCCCDRVDILPARRSETTDHGKLSQVFDDDPDSYREVINDCPELVAGRPIYGIRYLGIAVLLLTGWCSAVAQGLKTLQLPAIGDTLYHFVDDLPRHIDVSAAGANKFWNLSNLKAPYIQLRLVAAPSEGQHYAAFPKADIMMLDQQGHESYYASSTNALNSLGGTSFLLGSTEIEGHWSYASEMPLGLTRMVYGAHRDHSAAFEATFEVGQLPDQVREVLPNRVDSIRWQADISRHIETDGWGRVQIPGGQYEAVRVKIIDEAKHFIEVKRNGGAWEAVSAEVNDVMSDLFTKVSYHFISDSHPQPVASVYVDNDNKPIFVHYMADVYQAQYYQTATDGQWLYAYPNPAFSTVRFKIFDRRPGRYEIQFYNILGKRLFKRTYDISGTQTVELNIGQLEKGTYLYSLVDANGNKLITKRLIVLKP